MANFLRLLSDISLPTDRRSVRSSYWSDRRSIAVSLRVHIQSVKKKKSHKATNGNNQCRYCLTHVVLCFLFFLPAMENRRLSASSPLLRLLCPPLTDAPDWICSSRSVRRETEVAVLSSQHTHSHTHSLAHTHTERDTHMHAHTVIQPPHPTSLRSGTENHGKCSFSIAHSTNGQY